MRTTDSEAEIKLKKRNREYWGERFSILEDEQHNLTEAKINDIKKAYKQTNAELNANVDKWLQRISKNNGISIEEAHRLLTDDQLEEFHWSVDQYIARGKLKDSRIRKQLENASAKWHVTRYEALEAQNTMIVDKLMGKVQSGTEKRLYDCLEDTYYRSAFTIQKGSGVGFNLNALDEKSITKALMKPWTTDDRTFSDRIWANKAQLLDNVHKNMQKIFVLGKNPDEVAKEMAKDLGTSFYQSARLLRTESAYFLSLGEKESYKELGVDEFEDSAIIDSKTSEICFDMNGKHFPLSEWEVGVTAPPFHPNCRTTTCPYFDDEFTEDFAHNIQGKNADGQWEHIPDSMEYADWREKFVKTEEKEEKPSSVDLNKYLTASVESAESLASAIDMMSGKEKDTWISWMSRDNYEVIDTETDDKGSRYDSDKDIIYLEPGETSDVMVHETWHGNENGTINVVVDEGKPWSYTIDTPSKWVDVNYRTRLAEEDIDTLASKLKVNTEDHWFVFAPDETVASNKAVFDGWRNLYKEIVEECGEEGSGPLSDIISGITMDLNGGSIYGGGHPYKYWSQGVSGDDASFMSREATANYAALKFFKNDKMIKKLGELVPNYAKLLEEAYNMVMK